MNSLELSHDFLSAVIKHGDTVVDGTMGNGHDTLFLAQLTNNVFAFDVQQSALDTTRARLNGLPATLIHDGHENIDKYVTAPIRAAIFNLGYLPGSDKTVITKSDTTITALEKTLNMLAIGGRISIMVYRGHDGGICESNSVTDFVSSLGTNFNTKISDPRGGTSPFLIMIERTV
ncbi:MAG: class I SAM-dependent methyltransferase [Firmicutes bacterium]|nr:class I SAM-dependent methyltransferase [Bacillota bacterium]